MFGESFFEKECMKKFYDSEPIRLSVTVKDSKISTLPTRADVTETENTRLLTMIRDLRELQKEYEDYPVDRGMKNYPELNTLFSYLYTLFLDEDDKPVDIEVTVDISILKNKGNI